MSILVYGSTGYLGSTVCQVLENNKIPFIKAISRLENTRDVENELDRCKPEYVMNLAGLTGRPNIDWCEDNKLETIRINVVATLSLIDACYRRNIHITNYTTGCIYNGIGPFTEENEPNWIKSFYSKTKVQLEFLSKHYPNVLNLRIRMPVTSDFNTRNLIVKLAKYERVINVPNSITILDDMIPISVDMTIKKMTGIYNFTNPGDVTHNEILEMYKKYVDDTITIKNFTIEEQDKILKIGRCNCILDTTKIEDLYNIPNVKDSLVSIFENLN